MEPEQLLPQGLRHWGEPPGPDRQPARCPAPSQILASVWLRVPPRRHKFFNPRPPHFCRKSGYLVVEDFYSHIPDFFLNKLMDVKLFIQFMLAKHFQMILSDCLCNVGQRLSPLPLY